MQRVGIGQPPEPMNFMDGSRHGDDAILNHPKILKERPGIGMTANEKKVILAASLGTVIEYYDFYMYGALSSILSTKFFSGVDPQAAFIFTLFAFAAGFAIRPIGALVFGRFGDTLGRKYTFLITMTLMGGCTFLIGFLPTFHTMGIIAPILLVILRMIQGFAIGGEYGGAITYVAEHAPQGRRGYYTAYIQTCAACGLISALSVILIVQKILGEEKYTDFGWRIPFLLSSVLLVVSIWIRLKLDESPLFKQIKDSGKASKNPICEAFGTWAHARLAICALFSITSGEAVTRHTGMFYALFFLTQTVKVDSVAAQIMLMIALAIIIPGFCLCGWLSDKIGRKPVMLTGFILATICYFPIFWGITHFTNPALERALAESPVTVVADSAECSIQFNPLGTANYTTSCDVAKSALIKLSVNYNSEAAPAGSKAFVRVGNDTISATIKNFTAVLSEVITAHGYPAKADPAEINYFMTIFLLIIMLVFGCLVYGPLAACLAELFPTRIRYSAISLPLHIGAGWFGGFLPAITFSIVALTGNIYAGLWYPIAVTLVCICVNLFFLPETKNVDIED